MGHRTLAVGVLAVAAAAGLAVAVSRGGAGTKRPGSSAAPTAAGSGAPLAVPTGATLLASVHHVIARFDRAGGPSGGTIEPTWDDAPVTVPVIAVRDDWLQVRLPQRPNESTAWVRAGEVSLTYTPYRIVIEEAQRRLLLEDEGRVVDSFPAGIGTTTDPTPTGSFFVAYFAKPPSPGYGPFVIATSAHSNAITDWENSGDAEIAIHGPLGMDAAIGQTGARISHGCVRLHDDDLVKLRDVPVGTPVDIVAS